MRMLSIIALASLLGCASVTPGHVVLAVDLTAASEAARYDIVHGGRYWPALSPNTDYYQMPIMEQRSVWTRDINEGNPTDESITFAGRDGQPVNVDIGIGYQLSPDDAGIIDMVKKYGPRLDTIIDGRVRDSVRNSLNLCAAPYTVEQIYGDQKGPLMDCALKTVNDEYSPNGLTITRLTLNSEIRLPEKVKVAMEEANAAVQRAVQARNEVETTVAEGEKKVAAAKAAAEARIIEARAAADADTIRTKALTPEVIRLKEIQNTSDMIEKWNGVLPVTVMGDSSIPLVQLSNNK